MTQAAKAWSGRVDLINGTRFGVGGGGTGGGMLTRPDGYVGWTAADASEESVSGLIDALRGPIADEQPKHEEAVRLSVA